MTFSFTGLETAGETVHFICPALFKLIEHYNLERNLFTQKCPTLFCLPRIEATISADEFQTNVKQQDGSLETSLLRSLQTRNLSYLGNPTYLVPKQATGNLALETNKSNPAILPSNSKRDKNNKSPIQSSSSSCPDESDCSEYTKEQRKMKQYRKRKSNEHKSSQPPKKKKHYVSYDSDENDQYDGIVKECVDSQSMPPSPPCSDDNQQECESENIEALEKFFQNDKETPIMNNFA